MLHGVCSPFIETTPIIGFSISASPSPIARIKARCGVRVMPCLVTSERRFLIVARCTAVPIRFLLSGISRAGRRCSYGIPMEARPRWKRAAPGRPSSGSPRVGLRSGTMNSDDLVAVGVAQIGEIDLAGRALAEAGRVLDRGAAILDAGVV